jgi:hypothetical protein
MKKNSEKWDTKVLITVCGPYTLREQDLFKSTVGLIRNFLNRNGINVDVLFDTDFDKVLELLEAGYRTIWISNFPSNNMLKNNDNKYNSDYTENKEYQISFDFESVVSKYNNLEHHIITGASPYYLNESDLRKVNKNLKSFINKRQFSNSYDDYVKEVTNYIKSIVEEAFFLNV